MYHKRLSTYKRIGFTLKTDLITPQDTDNAIFDSQSYSKVFENDLTTAKREIIISSPGINTAKVNKLITLLRPVQERGVKVVVITLSTEAYPANGREWNIRNQTKLVNAGITLCDSSVYHEHFAIIDKSICWYGSMNLLSREKEDDNLIRLNSPKIADELLSLIPKEIQK